MRRSTVVIMLALTLTLSACSRSIPTTEQQRPPESPTASSPKVETTSAPKPESPAVKPAASVAETNGALCSPSGSGTAGTTQYQQVRRQEELLLTALRANLTGVAPADAPAAIGRLGPCLKAAPALDGSSQPLVVTFDLPTLGRYALFGVAVWQYQSTWMAASLLSDEMGNGLQLKWAAPAGQSLDVIAVSEYDGTGHGGEFLLYRLAADMALLWKGPMFDHFTPSLVTGQYLIAKYRDPDVYGDLNAANCCAPLQGQSVWERQGDQFVLRGSRLYPAIDRTARTFAKDWNEGAWERAARWTAESSLLAKMRSDAGRQIAIQLGAAPAALAQIEQAEADAWEALPPALRTSNQPVTELVWPAAPRSLLLKRLNGQWKVAGWK